jgi:hypothetical protein
MVVTLFLPEEWLETILQTGQVVQYIETNGMHFSFNLLRIEDLYMFRAILAHPQGALHKRILYSACV